MGFLFQAFVGFSRFSKAVLKGFSSFFCLVGLAGFLSTVALGLVQLLGYRLAASSFLHGGGQLKSLDVP